MADEIDYDTEFTAFQADIKETLVDLAISEEEDQSYYIGKVKIVVHADGSLSPG